MIKKIIISILFLININTPSFASIDILPKKIIIKDKERSSFITIINKDTKPGTFRAEIVNLKQGEDGVYEKLEDNLLNPAFDHQKIVRLSPRQFTLEPGSKQNIRISLRKPPNLPEGEYRFHAQVLRFGNEPEGYVPEKNQTIQMTMNMAISIPVIVRHGETSVKSKLTNMELKHSNETKSNRHEIHTTITREGNASSIGMLQAYWKSGNKKEKLIGEMGNVNIFNEINKRYIKMPLKEYPEGNGTIRLIYLDEVNKGSIYDEVTFEK